MPPKAPAPRLKSTVLDSKFWRNFAAKIWEKKPLVLKNVKSGLLEMGADEIFDLLVLYAEGCREQNDPTGFKFYVEGDQAEAEEVLQVLPDKSDKSLLGYHARMKAMFADYCLVCDELLQVNQKKQHLLTEFTDELYRHVGFPNRFSEMGLYLGNYRQTPFGVHVDSCGVFSFPVAGVKKFRLWDYDFGIQNPDLDRAFEYGKYKKHSQVLEAAPGDMTYWPSSAWHIAESNGSFSATWSLGVWVNQPHTELFTEPLKELLSHKMGARGAEPTTAFKNLHEATGEVTTLPQSFDKSIAILQALSAAELKETFLKSWMKHISLQGFKTVPRCDFKVSPKSQFQLRNEAAPILWQQSGMTKEKVYFSFGGVLVEGAKSSGLLNLVKDLNAGQSCLVGDYLKGLQRAQSLLALQGLTDAGAFSLV